MPRWDRDTPSYDGKLVAKLKYRLNDADVTIPVRLIQDTEKVEQSRGPRRGKGSKPTHTSGCIFRVYLEEVGLKPGEDEPESIEATDIEVLRAAVMEKLDGEHELDWEDWYLVQVSDSYSDGISEADLKLEWETLYTAELPDGRKVYRHGGYRRHDTIHDGVPKTGKGSSRRDGMTAMVRATDENEVALESLRDRVVLLRGMMMDFLSPKKIEKTLASTMDRLLPKPRGAK